MALLTFLLAVWASCTCAALVWMKTTPGKKRTLTASDILVAALIGGAFTVVAVVGFGAVIRTL